MLHNDNSSESSNETEKAYPLNTISFLDLPEEVIGHHLLPQMNLQEIDTLYKTSKRFQFSINNSPLEYEVDVIFPTQTLVTSKTYAELSLLQKTYKTRHETIKKVNEAEIDSLACKQNCYSFLSTKVCTNCDSLEGYDHTRRGMVEKKWNVSGTAGIAACIPTHMASFFTGLWRVCPTSPIEIICGASAGIALGTCMIVTYGTLGAISLSKSCHTFFNSKVNSLEARKNVLKGEIVNSKPQAIRMHD